MFSAQYQQRPVPLEGNLVRRAWFRYFKLSSLPPTTYLTKIIQSWDVANADRRNERLLRLHHLARRPG